MVANSVLLSIPGAHLHTVVLSVQSSLGCGDFVVSTCAEYGAPQRVEARVGDVAWPLTKHLPVLKASPSVYSFGLERSRDEYYVVILPADTPATVLEAAADILEGAAAFSTVTQLDAAHDQAGGAAGSAQAAGGAGSGQEAGDGKAGALASAGSSGDDDNRPPLQLPKYELPPSGSFVADRLAAGLVAGGGALAGTIQRAASTAGGGITSYAETQRRAAVPVAQPTKVSPAVKAGLQVAGVAAGAAATVTGWAAGLVGSASSAVAAGVASALTGSSGRGGGGGRGADEVTPAQVGALKTIGAAGLLAYVEVYDSLENAAKLVAAQSGTAASGYIAHKYGEEAGAVAAQSAPIAQNMVAAGLNLTRFGARAFVTRTAKRTAKMYLKHHAVGLPVQEQAAGARLPSHLEQLRAASAAAAMGAAGPVARQPLLQQA